VLLNASGCLDALTAPGVARALDVFVTKTVTPLPRQGNRPERIAEVEHGMLNSIGLANPGIDRFLAEVLPRLGELGVPIWVSVGGFAAHEYAESCARLDERDEVAAIELNVSCPNVKTGLDIGADPRELEAVVGRVRPLTRKPLIVKLTPNASDVPAAAAAAEAAGADAVSLINTLRAYAPHPRIRSGPPRPWLGGGTGGLSGPAIRAVALAQVRSVAARVAITIVGMGGVQTGRHAAELLEAGATAVAVGTESFRDPAAGTRIQHELHDLFAKSGDIADEA
jgi:dihydroorotate dehydrogenase (NAD+) catalytic subunit